MGLAASAIFEPGARSTESLKCQGADVDVTLSTPPGGSDWEPLNGQVVILDPDRRSWEMQWSTRPLDDSKPVPHYADTELYSTTFALVGRDEGLSSVVVRIRPLGSEDWCEREINSGI